MSRRNLGKSRSIRAPNSDLEDVGESRRALTTEQVLETFSSGRKRAFAAEDQTMSQETDSDYFDYSDDRDLGPDEPLDETPVGENSISPAQKRYRTAPVTPTATSSRKGQESLVQKKKKPFTAARPLSHSAPPRRSSITPPCKSGLASEGSTPLSRPVASKTLPETTTRNDAQPSSEGDSEVDIAATLKEISNTLSQVVRKIDKQETRLDSMEKKISSRSSISSSSSESGPKKIPPIIR